LHKYKGYKIQKLFLTFFYTGLTPKAPGTAGSIAGALIALVALHYFNLSLTTLLLATILITIVAVKEIDKYEKTSQTHDDKEIVVDEVAGVWLAICLTTGSMVEILLALIFFRIFDIWKPSYIGRIDRDVKGGLGVMGDDILAGIVAGICASASYKFFITYFL